MKNDNWLAILLGMTAQGQGRLFHAAMLAVHTPRYTSVWDSTDRAATVAAGLCVKGPLRVGLSGERHMLLELVVLVVLDQRQGLDLSPHGCKLAED